MPFTMRETYVDCNPKDLSVGLILNGLTSDFAGFVNNYNMHNMGKRFSEIDALLIEYEKDKGKCKVDDKGKDKQVYIPKPKNPKPSAKEHPTKDDTCHYCKEQETTLKKLQQGGSFKVTDDDSFDDNCLSLFMRQDDKKPFLQIVIKRATDLLLE
ncbi:hypothetical protein Tco_0703788 [Tanacetum coccineum]|uniref:Uncharacterized protein n=1 Tax=Tanacetum coccineum TaxID=301880 RepID=A0ABQ4Y1N4_9ASTR